ncbi:MAG: mechanosensitive ion channel family protein [Candidatus Marinimicrobia bacterium]|nr:mechanosensitive ion channel family protein [Candidatus Neomarinimicrobiota bacterium]
MMEWLRVPIWGNEMWRVLLLFAGVLGGLIGGRLARHYLAKSGEYLCEHGRRMRGAIFQALARAALPAVWVWAASQGFRGVVLPPQFDAWVQSGLDVLSVLAIGYIFYSLVDVVDAWLQGWAVRTESKMDDMLVPMVRKSLRITLVILVLAQVAQTLSDKPLTSIVAGLGVGSLAVALAARETIANFFGSLVILADKPFELGHLIQVGDTIGTVENVGFRSSRLRTLKGHLVSIPNGELATKTIENISLRPHLRRLTNLTITYDTPPAKVQEALDIVRDILKDHEGLNPEFPPRVLFTEFNDASLNLLMIYWYHPADWWAYLAFNERVNLEILRRFNEAGIEFAFPTQTLYLAGDPNRPLGLSASAGPEPT